MRAYLAGPLFTASELEFNRRLRHLLEQAGHQVWLPQEQTAGIHDAAAAFEKLLEDLAACDVVRANMDGPIPTRGPAGNAAMLMRVASQLSNFALTLDHAEISASVATIS